jgi:hypothetical protein
MPENMYFYIAAIDCRRSKCERRWRRRINIDRAAGSFCTSTNLSRTHLDGALVYDHTSHNWNIFPIQCKEHHECGNRASIDRPWTGLLVGSGSGARKRKASKMVAMIISARETPNPSLNRSANGRPPGPVRWYAVHFHRPGPGVLPLSPA